MAELVHLPDVAMVALRLRGAAAQALPMPGRSALRGSDRIIAISPDEWLIVADYGDAAALAERVEDHGGTVVDVSGNRVCYRVAGDDARWFLSAGCSIDLDRLKADDVVSTLLARAQVILIAEAANSFLILPRRSFAGHLEAWARTLET